MAQPFHVECMQALMLAGGLSYLPDEPRSLMDMWLKPVLWRVVWQPDRARAAEAMLAHTVYARIVGDKYPMEDTDMDAYAHCLGLTWDETPFLVDLLGSDVSGWHVSSGIRDMTCDELVAHARALADGGG